MQASKLNSPATIAIPAPSRPVPIPPQPAKRPPRWWIGVLMILLAAGAVWLALRQTGRLQPASRAASSTLRTASVGHGTLERTVRLSGVTGAEHFASVMTPRLRGNRRRGRSSGSDFSLLLQFIAPAGSHVRKGDLIASFDPLYMETRLDDYRASVAQEERDVKKMYAAMEIRRIALEQRIVATRGRMEKAALDLKTIPVRSAIVAERFQINYAEAKSSLAELMVQKKYFDISERAAIRRTELDLRESQNELQRAQVNLDRMTVHAPMDGMVVLQSIRRGVEYGQILSGDVLHSGQTYMQIVDTRSMVVHAKVNQVDAERLGVNTKARVRLDAFSDLELPATVMAVGAYAKGGRMRPDHVRDIDVRLRLDKMDPRVIPDFSVSADVVLQSEPDVALVPLECVFRDPSGGMPYSFVRSGQGWEKRFLELGLANRVSVAVRKGLAKGETVAAERPPNT